MTAGEAPLLTVGIPLHRSRPFVDVVSRNIEGVDRPDVEFLISDRTGHDDALEVLAARHTQDHRVVTLRTIDGAGWVDHCNALLRRARGRYFCWMPHDDTFPPGWAGALLECLEADPDLLMAFSRIDPVVTDAVPYNLDGYRHPKAGTGGAPWTVHDAVATLREWRGGYAFAGMFRRAPVVERGLLLPRTRDGVDADVAWVFGMALLGRLRYVDGIAYLKRHNAASAHRIWRRRVAHQLSLGWTLGRFAARYGRTPGVSLFALAAATDYIAERLTRESRRRCKQLLGRG